MHVGDQEPLLIQSRTAAVANSHLLRVVMVDSISEGPLLGIKLPHQLCVDPDDDVDQIQLRRDLSTFFGGVILLPLLTFPRT